jgi:hypothetical protein
MMKSLRLWVGGSLVSLTAFLAGWKPAELVVSAFCEGAGSELPLMLTGPALSCLLVLVVWRLVLVSPGGLTLRHLTVPYFLFVSIWAALQPWPEHVPEALRVELTVRAMVAMNASPREHGMPSSTSPTMGSDGWGNPLVIGEADGHRYIVSYGRCGKRDVSNLGDYQYRVYGNRCDDIVMMDGCLHLAPSDILESAEWMDCARRLSDASVPGQTESTK